MVSASHSVLTLYVRLHPLPFAQEANRTGAFPMREMGSSTPDLVYLPNTVAHSTPDRSRLRASEDLWMSFFSRKEPH